MSIAIKDAWVIALKVLAKMATGSGFKTCYIWGPPGIGKTWVAYQTAKKYYALTLTPETPASELRGFYMPVAVKGGGTEFKWTDGVIIKAMREGSRVVLNEIGHAGPDVLSFLFPVLEGEGTCRITLPNGDTVVSAKGFHVIATDNCPLEDLPRAIQNRFQAQLHITTYSPGGLAGLGDKVRVWASRSEIAYQDGRFISLRNWYALESALEQGFELEEACELVFGADKGENVFSGLRAAEVVTQEKAKARRKATVGVLDDAEGEEVEVEEDKDEDDRDAEEVTF